MLDKSNKVTYIVALSLLYVAFYGAFYPLNLPKELCRLLSFAASFFLFAQLLVLCLKKQLKKDFLPIYLVVAYLIFSIVTAFFFHEQSVILSIRVVLPWLSICLCFFLIRKKISEKTLYNSILFFCVLYIICYLIAVYSAPKLFFDPSGNDNDGMSMTRGWYRIKILGTEFVYFMMYWQLGLYVINKKKKQLVWASVLLLMVVLGLSRQHILVNSFLFAYFLLKKSSFIYKSIFVCVFSLLFFVVIPQTNIYQQSVALTESQMKANKGGADDVRVNGYVFFLSEYNDDIAIDVFGNGIYHLESMWGKQMTNIMRLKGFILSDIGIAKIFVFFGLIGLLLFCYLIKKIIDYKWPEKYTFVYYYTTSVLLTSVFSHQLDTSLMTLSIIYYLKFYVKGRQKSQQYLQENL